MADKPLFYQSVVPLNKELHKDLHLDQRANRFLFASNAHLIPAVIDEFEVAARHLPIVFLPTANKPTPVFVVGSQPGENRHVDATGAWTGGYVPAYLRRYPFIIGDNPGADPLVCMDEQSALLGSSGNLLLENDGSYTPTLAVHIQLMNDYRSASDRTSAFLDALVQRDLLRSITINVQTGDQASRSMHGFTIVDVERFNALGDADFLALRAAGFLPAIYAHLISLSALQNLAAQSGVNLKPVDDTESKREESLQMST